MRFLIVTKRFYMNKDLLSDRFGRNYHLPLELGRLGHRGLVLAADYRRQDLIRFSEEGVDFSAVPFGGLPPRFGLVHAYNAARDFRPDVIVGSTDVHFGAAACALAHRLNAACVYDLYDNYESFASARIPGMDALHRRSLRVADLVVAVSPALAEHVQDEARRVTVVGNGVDTSLFVRRSRKPARHRLGISSGETVVGYVGEISDRRGLDPVIAGVRIARREGWDLRLVLVGRNTSQLDLREPWITFMPPVPQAEVPEIISAFDVGVWPYLNDAWGRFVHPTKLAEYLACGVPTVATDLPEFRRVAPFDGVEWYEPNRPDAFVAAVRRSVDRLEPVVLPQSLTWEAQARLFEQALRSVVH